ncbi:MAG: metal-dependent hydrolase [Lachnospiraceae bacterium]|nr:metal-dependent hydrolase [Lachnospiraceae bacterium]
MMSKTHITMGIGASLLLLRPNTVSGISAAIIGGTFGAIIPDIDCKSTKISRDALYGRLIAGAVIAASVIWGQTQPVSLLKNILHTHVTNTILMGFLLMSVLCVAGRISGHRNFSHSFLFFILMGGSVYLIYPAFLPGFCIGCLSHLLLDCLNKKPVRLLYPLKGGFCLKMCYSDGVANTVLLWVGLVLMIFEIVAVWLQQSGFKAELYINILM